MRSSKHSKNKGLLVSNKKSSSKRRDTTEISEDFLAEFREIENAQRTSNRSERRPSEVRKPVEGPRTNKSLQTHQGNNSSAKVSENRTKSETIVFSKDELMNSSSPYKNGMSNGSNANNSSSMSAATSTMNLNHEPNVGFKKKNFNSEEFDRKVSEHANYDGINYDSSNHQKSHSYNGNDHSYASDDYLGNVYESNKKSRNSNKKRGNNKKEKKKTSSFAKKIKKVLIILILLIAICAVGVYYYVDVQLDKLGHVETDISEFEIDEQVKKDLKEYRNIAIMGVDARAGEDKSNTRTDAIIIASLNKKTGDVDLISVMRDSYLEMESSTGDLMYDKATHAHVYGGPINTCKMLNKALDLNISEFIVMDWNSVADTVDALGGITVNVQQNEIWDLNHWGPETAANTGRNWTQIYNTGEQRIDGVQAATYCRIRKNSGGDTGRTERMRKVIMAILKEVKAHPSKITAVADKVLPEVTTNMGTLDITSLLPQVINFEIKDNMGFPYNYYGGSVNGAWMAVPTTLSDNVKRLHEEAFNQSEYVPTARLEEISQNIINNTGISQGYEQ